MCESFTLEFRRSAADGQ